MVEEIVFNSCHNTWRSKVNRKLLPILLCFDHSCNRQKETAVRTLVFISKHTADKCGRHHMFLLFVLRVNDVQNLLSSLPFVMLLKGSSIAQYWPSLPFSQHVWHHQTVALYLPDPQAPLVWSIWTPLSGSCNNKASLCLTCIPSKGI